MHLDICLHLIIKNKRRRSRKLSRMDTFKANSNVETPDVDHENVIAGKKELVQTCSLDSLLQSTMWGPPNVIWANASSLIRTHQTVDIYHKNAIRYTACISVNT